jgi:N-acetylmuramoyl-L-alanine amidase
MVAGEAEMRFVIDPGHGGEDPGAIGPAGTKEKDISLAVSMMVAGVIAGGAGTECRLTRYSDKAVSLDSRCGIANSFSVDAFLSIHCNSFRKESARGFEVWTSPGYTAADEIASSIWLSLRAAFPDMIARADTSDGDPDKESRFRVLVGTSMPAVLVELGFISNPEEESMLKDAAFQTQAAYAIGSSFLEAVNGTR